MMQMSWRRTHHLLKLQMMIITQQKHHLMHLALVIVELNLILPLQGFSLSLSRSLTHSLTLSLTHSLTCTTHTHTHTPTLSFMLSFFNYIRSCFKSVYLSPSFYQYSFCCSSNGCTGSNNNGPVRRYCPCCYCELFGHNSVRCRKHNKKSKHKKVKFYFLYNHVR